MKSRPATWSCAVFVAASLLYATVCAASCLAASPVATGGPGAAQHEGCGSESAPAPAGGSPSDCGTHDHDASWNVAKKALGFVPVLPAVEFLADRPAALSSGVATFCDANYGARIKLAATAVKVSPLRI